MANKPLINIHVVLVQGLSDLAIVLFTCTLWKIYEEYDSSDHSFYYKFLSLGFSTEG